MPRVNLTGHGEYDDRLARWAARLDALTLTNAQAEGFECVAGCGYNQLRDRDPDRPMLPVGFGPRGQVFACSPCDTADHTAQRSTPADPASEVLAARADEILAARSALAERAERGAVRLYDRIAGEILRFGLALPELADLSGIGHGHLSSVLDGDAEFTATQLLLLAAALDADPAAWFASPIAARLADPDTAGDSTPTYRVGQAVIWTAAPNCSCWPRHVRGLASFRRIDRPDHAEVFTCSGSRTVRLADLRTVDPAELSPVVDHDRPAHELDYTQRIGGGQ